MTKYDTLQPGEQKTEGDILKEIFRSIEITCQLENGSTVTIDKDDMYKEIKNKIDCNATKT